MTGDDRRAYSPELLDAAIEQITQMAERADVELALCGGLAMQSYGSDRLTKDVDFVASAAFPQPAMIERPLSFGGAMVRAPNGVAVDWIVRSDGLQALYASALSSAISRPGVACRVVGPEYLAAMKIAAGRARDILDLHYLIVSGVISLPDARALIERYVGGWYAARDFDAHVEDAALELERERKARG